MKFLTVDLYNDFQCIGGACPDSCCVGWKIDIDEETYRKMKEKESILGIPANDWIVKKGDRRMVKLNHSRCPMLDENNLCTVVCRLGPQYLSKTCSVYPRKLSQYGDVIEGHLVFSCPEVVARLMDRSELQFDSGEDMTSQPTETYAYEKLYLFESNMRIVMVDIFQHPAEISLCTRAALAFDILEKAVELYRQGQTDVKILKEEMDWCFQENRPYIMDKGLRETIDEGRRYHFLQKMQFLIDNYNCSDAFRDMIRQVNEYFAQNDQNQYLRDVKEFRDSQYPYQGFYSRYWIYRIFSDIISIPEFEKVKDNFMCIAAGFCLTQIMALVSFVKKGVLDKEQYIYIISNLSRMIEHNHKFREKLLRQLDENNINGLAGLLLMI